MNTPKSDAALELYPEFCARIRERLESGKRAYGDSSFDRPAASLVEEIRQEILDQAGWSFIAYARLERLDELMRVSSSQHEVKSPDAGLANSSTEPKTSTSL